MEVEPFLIMAVGVDNIFIIVQRYQRLSDKATEPGDLSEKVSLICSEAAPSMLLTALCECMCFGFGALSTMPAVQTFSLYAALAIFFNFFLQLTLFLAVFVWDAKRQEAGALEMCCCVRMPTDMLSSESYMYRLFKCYYAPVLLGRDSVRYGTVCDQLNTPYSSRSHVHSLDVSIHQLACLFRDGCQSN